MTRRGSTTGTATSSASGNSSASESVDPGTVEFDSVYAPEAIASYAPLRRHAERQDAAGGCALPGVPPDLVGDRLLVRLALGPARVLRHLRARLPGWPCEDLGGGPTPRPRHPVGRLPGSARLGGLFPNLPESY